MDLVGPVYCSASYQAYGPVPPHPLLCSVKHTLGVFTLESYIGRPQAVQSRSCLVTHQKRTCPCRRRSGGLTTP